MLACITNRQQLRNLIRIVSISDGSGPVAPFPRTFQVEGVPRGTHWTVDAVLSNARLTTPPDLGTLSSGIAHPAPCQV